MNPGLKSQKESPIINTGLIFISAYLPYNHSFILFMKK
nr:MAG TPA: hypothetical protein [Caudoviricetes sp.]DAZ33127.1 MAG TPA: hypothetical protein [Caudoviricetes sp.]